MDHHQLAQCNCYLLVFQSKWLNGWVRIAELFNAAHLSDKEKEKKKILKRFLFEVSFGEIKPVFLTSFFIAT